MGEDLVEERLARGRPAALGREHLHADGQLDDLLAFADLGLAHEPGRVRSAEGHQHLRLGIAGHRREHVDAERLARQRVPVGNGLAHGGVEPGVARGRRVQAQRQARLGVARRAREVGIRAQCRRAAQRDEGEREERRARCPHRFRNRPHPRYVAPFTTASARVSTSSPLMLSRHVSRRMRSSTDVPFAFPR